MPSELTRTEYEKYCQTLEDTVIAFWNQRDESHLKENIRQLWEVGVPSREIKSQVEQILVKSERSSVEAEFYIGPTRYRASAESLQEATAHSAMHSAVSLLYEQLLGLDYLHRERMEDGQQIPPLSDTEIDTIMCIYLEMKMPLAQEMKRVFARLKREKILNHDYFDSRMTHDELGDYSAIHKQGEREPAQEEEKLRPALAKAWSSYHFGESSLSTMCDQVTDQTVYQWLENNGPKEYALPQFNTWSRYVREARKILGRNKNAPRTGRKGRSIQNASDL